MRIRNLDYDNRVVTISQQVNGVVELRRIEMKDYPLTLTGVFGAMGEDVSFAEDGELMRTIPVVYSGR